jgi:hypothetical protein
MLIVPRPLHWTYWAFICILAFGHYGDDEAGLHEQLLDLEFQGIHPSICRACNSVFRYTMECRTCSKCFLPWVISAREALRYTAAEPKHVCDRQTERA